MHSIDLDILKYMSQRDQYFELKDTINKGLCVKESWQMLADFGEWFKENPNEASITEDFILWQRIKRHPSWKPDEALRMFGLMIDDGWSDYEARADAWPERLPDYCENTVRIGKWVVGVMEDE